MEIHFNQKKNHRLRRTCLQTSNLFWGRSGSPEIQDIIQFIHGHMNGHRDIKYNKKKKNSGKTRVFYVEAYIHIKTVKKQKSYKEDLIGDAILIFLYLKKD